MVTNTSRYPLVYPLILLAGGQASRMGTPKGLLQRGEKYWLVEQLERFSEAGGEAAVVVLGYGADLYFSSIPWLERAQEETCDFSGIKVTTVLNPHPQYGPFSSLQAGAERILRAAHAGAFVLPVDVPAAARSVWEALSIRMTPRYSACVPQHQGRGGHPVLLSSVLLRKLASMSPDDPMARLDMQLRSLDSTQLLRVEVDDSCVRINLNTPEDWGKFVF